VTGRLRWAGVAGGVLLAIGGYLAGATPGPAPASQAEALWGTGAEFRIGLAAWLAGLALVGWAWWRIGGAVRAGAGLSTRWMLVTGLLWAAPLLLAPPLGSRDLYAYACQGAVWLDGHDPYALGAAGGGCRWLAAVPSLWHDTPAPYGPLALVVSAAAVALARAVTGDGSVQLLVVIAVLRVAAAVGLGLVAGYGPRLARACGIDPAGAVWLGLASPLVLVHLVAGSHHDALVAGLVVSGLALAAGPDLRSGPAGGLRGGGGTPAGRGWPGWRPAAGAGLVLGLAVTVKVTAVAAVPFGLLLAARRSSGAAGVAAGAGVAGFAGLTLLTGLGLGWAGGLSGAGSLAQWSSPPTGLGMAAGYALRGLGAPEAYDTAVATARLAGLVALVAVSVAMLVRAWRFRAGVRVVVACAGSVLAAVVLLGPVVYPWYAVVPLAVLAASVADSRARRWLAVAALVLTGLALPSGLGLPVLTRFPGALLMVVLVGLVSRWWWRHRRTAWPGRSPAAPRPDRPAGRPPDRPGRPPGPPAPVR
jgi:hypothetical protein